jgi:hypothetical protein
MRNGSRLLCSHNKVAGKIVEHIVNKYKDRRA